MKAEEVKYGMLAVDVNNKTLGTVDYIVMDSWSGEPRKFMVRQDSDAGALYFISGDVAEVTDKKVKLNIAEADMEKT